ncbi:hypothetical protein FRC00_013377, partial [Tulasnella sp. 408]
SCALEWAIDSNKIICDFVLKTDPTNKELSGTYYRGAAPIIQQQIAKGGVRLAVWLNQLFGSGEAGQLPPVHNRVVVQGASLKAKTKTENAEAGLMGNIESFVNSFFLWL